MNIIFSGHYDAADSWNRSLFNTIKISLKFVPMGPINNILALVSVKPLPMHICVPRLQWVKIMSHLFSVIYSVMSDVMVKQGAYASVAIELTWARIQYKDVITGIGNPIMEIRRS